MKFLKNTRIRNAIALIFIHDLIFMILVVMFDKHLAPHLFLFLAIFSAFCLGFFIYLDRKESKKLEVLILNLIANPSYDLVEKIVAIAGEEYRGDAESVRLARLDDLQRLDIYREDLLAYRDMIELWAHEIKIPVSTIDLILQNHKTGISPLVYQKLKYENVRVKNNIDKVLHFARTTSDRKDYKLKSLDLGDVVEAALNNFYPIIAEEGIIVRLDIGEISVVSDYNSLTFIISQLISNAIKYTADTIELRYDNIDGLRLIVANNGLKISPKDLPFIYEKGYTGGTTQKESSTGMGLYLAKSYADDLGIKLEVINNEDGDFKIALNFQNNKEL